MSKKIDDVLTEEAAAAENYDMEDTLPEGVAVTRPNLGRPTVVSVRLSADEHARLQRAAEKANLPLSTLMRIWALDRLGVEEEGSESSVAERLRRLEEVVFQRPA
jgi:antitoxin component HigA of HigAB toxin-antitoxin module